MAKLDTFWEPGDVESHPIISADGTAVSIHADCDDNILWVKVDPEVIRLAKAIAGKHAIHWDSEKEENLARRMTGTPPYSQDRFALCDMGEKRRKNIKAAIRVLKHLEKS